MSATMSGEQLDRSSSSLIKEPSKINGALDVECLGDKSEEALIVEEDVAEDAMIDSFKVKLKQQVADLTHATRNWERKVELSNLSLKDAQKQWNHIRKMSTMAQSAGVSHGTTIAFHPL
eukprot:Clim_evm17s227 gene=Clim_evmTU17s227